MNDDDRDAGKDTDAGASERSMRVLLIEPKYGYKEAMPWIPIGKGYLAAVLREDGFDVRIIDNALHHFDDNELARLIAEYDPHIVCTGGMTLQVNDTRRIAALARKACGPETLLVGGGIHYTLVPSDGLSVFDLVVVGEGEQTVLELCRRFRETGSRQWDHYQDIDGLCGQGADGSEVFTKPRRFIAELDTLPLPAYDLLEVPKYNDFLITGEPAVSIMTGRGCPFDCEFCASPALYGRRVRYFSIDRVFMLIELLMTRYGFTNFRIMDDTFAANKKRVITFCKEIINRGLNINLTCLTHVKTADSEMFSWMKKAGFSIVAFGFESGNNRILKLINKGITVDQAIGAAEQARQAGLAIEGLFMIGNMGETRETIEDSIAFAKRCNPAFDGARRIGYNWFQFATPFPGSRFHVKAKEFGTVVSSNYDDYSHQVPVFIPHGLDATVMISLRERALAETNRTMVNAKDPGRAEGKDTRAVRVLHVAWGHPPHMAAGPVYYVHQLCQEQRAQGMEVACFVANCVEEPQAAGGPEIAVREFDGIAYHIVRNRPIHYFGWQQPGLEIENGAVEELFCKVLSSFSPQIVHIHNLMGLSMRLPLFAKKYGCKTFFSAHNYWMLCPRDDLFAPNETNCPGPRDGAPCAECVGNPGGTVMFMARAAAARMILNTAVDRVLAVSDRVRQIFINCGIEAGKITVCRLGSTAALQNWTKIGNARQTDPAPAGPLRFCCFGSLIVRKGVALLIEAAGHLAHRRGEFSISVYGAGGSEALQRRIARTMSSPGFPADAVSFKGFYRQEDLPKILGEMHVAVIPPLWEDNGPQTVMESLGAGLPVIGSRIGGIPDFVGDGKNGLLFAAGDARDLARAMEQLLDNRELVRELRLAIQPPLTIAGHAAEVSGLYAVAGQVSSPALGDAGAAEPSPAEGLCRTATGGRRLVSIIIPVFNKIEYTRMCIESLIRNTPEGLYECIVVDNASTDGTRDFLIGIERDVKVITNPTNVGFAAACNQGAKVASTDYILFLNNDTEPLKGWLEPLMRILSADPSVAAAGSKLLFPDGTLQHAGVIFIEDRKLGNPLIPSHIYYKKPGEFADANRMRTYQALTAACLLIRKKSFEDVGGFDESYWNGYEDVDLCFKLGEKGWKLVYQPESVLIHYESKSGPERYIREKQNLLKLQERWLGRVKPDLIVEKDGTVLAAEAGVVGLYSQGGFVDSAMSHRKAEPASVVVLTYNSSKTIVACLKSIADNLRVGDEVFVVDNNSSDNTADIVGKFIKDRKQFSFIRNAENLGFSAGTNAGIRCCRNPYVILLNPDTVVSEGWIDHLLLHFDDPKVGAVGPISDYVAGLQKMSLYRKEEIPAGSSTDDIAVKFHQWNRGRSVETKLLIGFCMGVRRDVLEEIGALDEDLYLGNDDLELSWRLRANGYRLKVATDTFIHHEGQQSFNTVKKETTSSLVRESTDALYSKLRMAYGDANVPKPVELWGMEWFTPTDAVFNPLSKFGDLRERPKLKAPRAKEGMVSIVILTFNQLDYTRECLASIRAHTPEPHEVILVDNGSADGTVKWLRQQARENRNYTVIENGANLGFARGCNQGITAALGEYVLLLNNDVVVTEDWVSGMLECLRSSPDVGIVGPMTNSISGPQKVRNVGYTAVSGLDAYAADFRGRHRHRRIPMRRIVGFCMFMRKSLLDKIGLLDETFGTGNFEDDDLCLRSALEGYTNLIAGDVFIHHYGSRSFIGNKIDYSNLMTGNRKKFDEKWSGIDIRSDTGRKVLAVKALDKAEEAFHKEDIQKAVDIYLEGIRFAQNDRRLYRGLAAMLIDAKRYRDALDVLNEMPDQARDEAEWHALAGYCKDGLGDIEEAGTMADRSLAINERSALAANLKGIIEFKMDNRTAALEWFRSAIGIDGGYGEPCTNIGVLLWSESRHEESIEWLEKGLDLSPLSHDSADIYYSAVTQMQSYGRAEAAIGDILALYPLNKRLTFLLIDCLLRQERFADAMDRIEDVIISFGPDDDLLAAALSIRGKVGYKSIGSGSGKGPSISLCMIVRNEEQFIGRCLKSAAPVADEMIVVDTGSTDRTKQLAAVFGARLFDYPWQDDFSAARNFSIEQAAGEWIFVLDGDEVISPRDHEALLRLVKGGARSAYSFVTRNYTDRANVEEWHQNDGRYPLEQAGIGWLPSVKARLFPRDKRIHFVNPVHEMVEPSLKQAGLTVKPSGIPIHHYGKLVTAEKNRTKGEAYFELGKKKLLEQGDDLKAIMELAVQAAELEKYEEAIGLWKRAIALNPGIAKAHFNLGYALLKVNRFEESIAASRRALELEPGLKEANLNLASALLCRERPDEALQVLQDMLAANTDHPSATILMAVTHIAAGRKAEGLQYIERLKKMNYDCAQVFHYHASRLLHAGLRDYALRLVETALEQGFTTAGLDELMKMLSEHRRRT